MPYTHPHCKLADFTDNPKKYKKMDETILQDIILKESEIHEMIDQRIVKLNKLMEYKIQNHPLPQCRICFKDLNKMRDLGRKVKRYCSDRCRKENERREKEVFPEQVRQFGGYQPIIIWSEKRNHGHRLPAYRQDILYTSTVKGKRKTKKIDVKKGKEKPISD